MRTSSRYALCLYLMSTCVYADHHRAHVPGFFQSADQVFTKAYGIHLAEGEIRLDADIEYGVHVRREELVRERIEDFTFSTTLNYGLTDATELFIALPLGAQWYQSTSGASHVSGSRSVLGDVRVGVRHRLYGESDWLPEVTATASVSFPTGSRPTELVLLEHAGWLGVASISLIKSLSFAHLVGRIGIGAGGIHGVPFLEYSGGIGFSLREDLDLGFTIDGTVPTRSLGLIMGDRVVQRTSLTYLITPEWAVELSGGPGLTKASPDFVVNLGVSAVF